jgi:hypothetical protein
MLRQIAGENPAPETAKPCFDAADGRALRTISAALLKNFKNYPLFMLPASP